MAHQQGYLYATDPNGIPVQPGLGAGGYYYPRSAQNSPFAQPVLLPGMGATPPSAASPLPAPVWIPYHSPNTQAQALPPAGGHSPGRGAPPATVLIDVLHAKRTLGIGSKHPHIVYDIRDFPENALVNTRPNTVQLSDAHLEAPLTNPPVASIKVVSKAFPWEIDVDSGDDSVPVTVGDLITAVHETLQKHITGSEWWIVTDSVREKVTAQYLKSCQQSSASGSRNRREVEKPRQKDEGLRRVDWLLENNIMQGLERDDSYAQLRFRDRDTRDKTWVLVTGPNSKAKESNYPSYS